MCHTRFQGLTAHHRWQPRQRPVSLEPAVRWAGGGQRAISRIRVCVTPTCLLLLHVRRVPGAQVSSRVTHLRRCALQQVSRQPRELGVPPPSGTLQKAISVCVRCNGTRATRRASPRLGLLLQAAGRGPLGSKARFVRAALRYRTPRSYNIIHSTGNSRGGSLQKPTHVVVEAEKAQGLLSARWRRRKPAVSLSPRLKA